MFAHIIEVDFHHEWIATPKHYFLHHSFVPSLLKLLFMSIFVEMCASCSQWEHSGCSWNMRLETWATLDNCPDLFYMYFFHCLIILSVLLRMETPHNLLSHFPFIYHPCHHPWPYAYITEVVVKELLNVMVMPVASLLWTTVS